MKKVIASTVIAAAAMTGTAGTAQAKEGDWLIRLRGIIVAPNEDSGGITPAFPTEGVSVNNSVMPEVDVTYMASDHIGFELIAATTKHSASGITGTTGTIGDLASTWVLPPTLTVQYHPVADGPVRPYVGAGVNYALFYAEDASSGLEAAVGQTDVDMEPSFGWAVQAGIDIDLNDRFFVNLDAKYINIETTATLRTANAGTQRVDIELNPLVLGVGIGTRF